MDIVALEAAKTPQAPRAVAAEMQAPLAVPVDTQAAPAVPVETQAAPAVPVETQAAPTVALEMQATPVVALETQATPAVEYISYIKRPRTPAQLEALSKARAARTQKRLACKHVPVAKIEYEPQPPPPQRTFLYVV